VYRDTVDLFQGSVLLNDSGCTCVLWGLTACFVSTAQPALGALTGSLTKECISMEALHVKDNKWEARRHMHAAVASLLARRSAQANEKFVHDKVKAALDLASKTAVNHRRRHKYESC
jgi:hypothetical protein